MAGIADQGHPAGHQLRQRFDVERPVGHHPPGRGGADQARQIRRDLGQGLLRHRLLQQPALLGSAGGQGFLLEEAPVGDRRASRSGILRPQVEGVGVDAAAPGHHQEVTGAEHLAIGHHPAPDPIPQVVEPALGRQQRRHPREHAIGADQQIALPALAVAEARCHAGPILLPVLQLGAAAEAAGVGVAPEGLQDRLAADQ